MSVLRTATERATRYAPHIEELRDFFAVVHLHSGTPDDLVALAGRLDASDSFREDLASMVRVILLREGGSIPRADLLEILTVAIGGAGIDHVPQMQQAVIQQSIHQIFAFLNDVLRRPWNQAPGEDRLEPPRLDPAAPAPPAARESEPPAAREYPSTVRAVHIPGPETALLATHDGVPIYSREVAPASTHETAPIVSPETTLSLFPSLDAALVSSPGEPDIYTQEEADISLPDDEPANLFDETPAAPTPAFVRPESVYSRFTDLVAGMQTLAAQTPAITAPDPGLHPPPEPSLSFAPEDLPPDPAPAIAQQIPPPSAPFPAPAAAHIYAGNVVPWPNPILEASALPAGEAQHNLALEQFPNPAANIFFPPPVPATPPPATPALAAESHPAPATPPPPSTLDPEPPSPAVFQAMLLQKLNPKLAALRFPASPLRIAVISAAGATLFVAALMVAAHRHANSVQQAANRPLANPALNPAANNPPPEAAAEPAVPAGIPAAPIPTPSTASAAGASPRHAPRRIRDDDYIAPPYSTPIPPELAAQPPTPGPSSVASARLDKPDQPIAPDAVSASRPVPPPRHVSVSSRELAILSAPQPGYPILAKVAHIQGQVVVQAVVDRDGTVSAAHVLSGHHLLRGAAVDAVLRRRYRPYRVDGHPVEVSTTITVSFPPPASSPKPTATYANLSTH